jgi:hypothetical protein
MPNCESAILTKRFDVHARQTCAHHLATIDFIGCLFTMKRSSGANRLIERRAKTIFEAVNRRLCVGLDRMRESLRPNLREARGGNALSSLTGQVAALAAPLTAFNYMPSSRGLNRKKG